ncbi:MAG: glycosyl hydrolase [Xanthomonadales bacterium]|nr:glycosyl hydrolase [Xanthomonadales bacterium]
MSRFLMLLALLYAPLGQGAPSGWDESQLNGLEWREVGPYRGGRSAAVAGIPQDRETFYFGSTGGGVWKTTNGGGKWSNISDGYFGGSIGAVAVSSWDPNVIYVGTGEKTVRGNVSVGHGVWKSTDAGRTWSHTGLRDTERIPRIRIHPKNPDLVYVAALGHLFGPNEQRGIFRSSDGGKSWQNVLYVNDSAGAVDLVMDPTNPRILYATTWRVLRTPYSLESGGEGSGIWKSTDGGDNWVSLAGKDGMPKPPLGIAGISVSGSNPDNLYAIIEAAEGGVFRSTDAGETWKRVNQERKLRQRAWYYTRIEADPIDEDVVYVLNVRFHKSRDGGKTFEPIATPHGDNHDLWIDPNDPKRMIEANDGGANISYDGGENWSVQSNQPTAQMYRVSTDNAFPYRLLGGQQDNSAIRIRSRSAFGTAIGARDWEPTAGGESGHVIARPDNPDIVYGGSYGGYLIRYDHSNGDVRAINVWPDNPMGWGAAELKYRFNWNFPLMISPHDPDTLYAAGNVLFKTTDEGQTWQPVSPDLTRNIKEKQGPSGGPITKDNTSVEYYGTIFAIAESLSEPGVLWTGSDDGLLHISRDGGQNWQDVTPTGRKLGLPKEIQINSIEAHPFESGGLYVAATAYKSDDFKPYLFKTMDYGQNWEKITDGIQTGHFTRVIRADDQQRGLLFAGTESGIYLSQDDGQHWQSVQLNLPVVPITDLALKQGNLIAATQGRGYWILDDVTLLRQAESSVFKQASYLFKPAPAWRLRNGSREEPENMGSNPPAGVVLYYWLAEELAEDSGLSLEISDLDGNVIRTFTAKPPEGEEPEEPILGDDDRKLDTASGLNRFVWDMHYPSVEKFKGLVLWNRSLDGEKAIPGTYQATLKLGDMQQSVSLEVRADPRLDTSPEAYRAQFEFVSGINRKLTETHRAIARLREAKSQLATIEKRIEGDDGYAELIESVNGLQEKLGAIEATLYQTKMESPQDPLNFPIRLNDKLAGLMSLSALGTHPPTNAAIAVRDELVKAIDGQLNRLDSVMSADLADFNRQAAKAGLEAVRVTALDRLPLH